jgi:prolyl-tRNA synthetase
MRWSQTLIPTLKDELPGIASIGHRLMLRSGMIRELGARFTFLPLGSRSLTKVQTMLREILEEIGAQEVSLPDPHDPASIENLAASCIRSYKQLPLSLFQFHNTSRLSCFAFARDESRIVAWTGRLLTEMRSAWEQLRLTPFVADASDGQRLAILSPSGADEIMTSDKGNYAATMDTGQIAPRPWNFAGEPHGSIEKIATPGRTSVAEVCAQLGIRPSQILKTLVFTAASPIAIRWLVAVVRGDHQVNLHKLAKVASEMGVTQIAIADSEAAMQTWPMGFVGPDAAMKLPDAILVVDVDAAQGQTSWFAGGNEQDIHVANFNWFRECGDKLADPTRTAVADIRTAIAGDPSPLNDGGVLEKKTASVLSALSHHPLSATFDEPSGHKLPLWFGTCDVALERLLTAVVEISHDKHGILWPPAIAPFSVVITPVKYDGEVRQAADRLYTQLTFEEIDVLLDDRDARAGVKFADADLIGFPLRVTLGAQTLHEGHAELKRRNSVEIERIRLDELPARIRQALVDF